MSWCSDAPEDEAISLFTGLLANPDMTLNQGVNTDTTNKEFYQTVELRFYPLLQKEQG